METMLDEIAELLQGDPWLQDERYRLAPGPWEQLTLW